MPDRTPGVVAGVSPANFQRADGTAATTEDRQGADDFVLNACLWREPG
jgi:hypothetical protein